MQSRGQGVVVVAPVTTAAVTVVSHTHKTVDWIKSTLEASGGEELKSPICFRTNTSDIYTEYRFKSRGDHIENGLTRSYRKPFYGGRNFCSIHNICISVSFLVY